MSLRLVYFAALREELACEQEVLDLPPEVRTLADLRTLLAARGGPWQEALGPHRLVRGAIDQRIAQADQCLAGAAEVAFFPPVTGG